MIFFRRHAITIIKRGTSYSLIETVQQPEYENEGYIDVCKDLPTLYARLLAYAYYRVRYEPNPIKDRHFCAIAFGCKSNDSDSSNDQFDDDDDRSNDDSLDDDAPSPENDADEDSKSMGPNDDDDGDSGASEDDDNNMDDDDGSERKDDDDSSSKDDRGNNDDSSRSKDIVLTEEEVFMFNGQSYSTYQEMVEAKRQRNRDVLVSSGLLEAKAAMDNAATEQKRAAAPARGLKVSDIVCMFYIIYDSMI